MQRWEQWRRRRRADTPAVSAGQAGDGSSQPTDATGTARAMLERAFPQAGQQAQNTADGQGVAQNTAVPVVNGQPVYSDIALADYMAKQAAQQKFGDVQQTPVGLQETMHAQDMSAQLDAIDMDAAMPEENVVASEKNNGTIDTESREDISTSFKGIKTLEEIRIELEHAGLTQIKIDEILKKPKGKRPDPSTYLSEEYILGHLSQFNNGAAYILPKNDYDLYYRGTPKIARKDGTLFVTSKNYLNHILQQAQGNLDYVERALGYQSNSLVSGRFVIININNPQRYGVTVPSGNEVGANSEWIPGGYTSGGVPEAVVYNVINDLDSISIDIIELERDK